jgi:hypothetical protein
MPPVWWPLSAFPFAGETSSPTYLRGRSWNQGHTIWVKNNSDPDTTVVRLRGQNLASADRFDGIPGRGGRAATIHAGQPALADGNGTQVTRRANSLMGRTAERSRRAGSACLVPVGGRRFDHLPPTEAGVHLEGKASRPGCVLRFLHLLRFLALGPGPGPMPPLVGILSSRWL